MSHIEVIEGVPVEYFSLIEIQKITGIPISFIKGTVANSAIKFKLTSVEDHSHCAVPKYYLSLKGITELKELYINKPEKRIDIPDLSKVDKPIIIDPKDRRAYLAEAKDMGITLEEYLEYLN